MVKYSFYRPHKRVTFDNTKLDLKTGELVEVPSMTKQEFVAECDINNIIKQYSATGQMKHISARAAQGQYLDLPDDLDFQTSLEIVRQAQEAFATLPSGTRARFENDPKTSSPSSPIQPIKTRRSSSASLPTHGRRLKSRKRLLQRNRGLKGGAPLREARKRRSGPLRPLAEHS